MGILSLFAQFSCKAVKPGQVMMDRIVHWTNLSLPLEHKKYIAPKNSYLIIITDNIWSFFCNINLQLLRKHSTAIKVKVASRQLHHIDLQYCSIIYTWSTDMGQAVACAPVTQPAWFDPRSGQVSWVRFSRGFSSPLRQMSGSFRPEYHLTIIIIHNHSLRAPMTWDVDAP